MPANSGTGAAAEIFPGIANPQGTGLGGAPQAPNQSEFDVSLGSVAVAANPFESSQGPRVMASVNTGASAVQGQYPDNVPLVGSTLEGGVYAGQDDRPMSGQEAIEANQVLYHPDSNGLPR